MDLPRLKQQFNPKTAPDVIYDAQDVLLRRQQKIYWHH